MGGFHAKEEKKEFGDIGDNDDSDSLTFFPLRSTLNTADSKWDSPAFSPASAHANAVRVADPGKRLREVTGINRIDDIVVVDMEGIVCRAETKEGTSRPRLLPVKTRPEAFLRSNTAIRQKYLPGNTGNVTSTQKENMKNPNGVNKQELNADVFGALGTGKKGLRQEINLVQGVAGINITAKENLVQNPPKVDIKTEPIQNKLDVSNQENVHIEPEMTRKQQENTNGASHTNNQWAPVTPDSKQDGQTNVITMTTPCKRGKKRQTDEMASNRLHLRKEQVKPQFESPKTTGLPQRCPVHLFQVDGGKSKDSYAKLSNNLTYNDQAQKINKLDFDSDDISMSQSETHVGSKHILSLPATHNEVTSPEIRVNSPQTRLAAPLTETTSRNPKLTTYEKAVPPTKPDMVLPKPAVALPKPDVVLPKPEVALPKPAVALPKPDVALTRPEVAILKRFVATPKVKIDPSQFAKPKTALVPLESEKVKTDVATPDVDTSTMTKVGNVPRDIGRPHHSTFIAHRKFLVKEAEKRRSAKPLEQRAPCDVINAVKHNPHMQGMRDAVRREEASQSTVKASAPVNGTGKTREPKDVQNIDEAQSVNVNGQIILKARRQLTGTAKCAPEVRAETRNLQNGAKNDQGRRNQQQPARNNAPKKLQQRRVFLKNRHPGDYVLKPDKFKQVKDVNDNWINCNVGKDMKKPDPSTIKDKGESGVNLVSKDMKTTNCAAAHERTNNEEKTDLNAATRAAVVTKTTKVVVAQKQGIRPTPTPWFDKRVTEDVLNLLPDNAATDGAKSKQKKNKRRKNGKRNEAKGDVVKEREKERKDKGKNSNRSDDDMKEADEMEHEKGKDGNHKVGFKQPVRITVEEDKTNEEMKSPDKVPLERVEPKGIARDHEMASKPKELMKICFDDVRKTASKIDGNATELQMNGNKEGNQKKAVRPHQMPLKPAKSTKVTGNAGVHLQQKKETKGFDGGAAQPLQRHTKRQCNGKKEAKVREMKKMNPQRRKILKIKRSDQKGKVVQPFADIVFCRTCADTKQPNGQNLFSCTKCKSAFYCTRGCQHKDWRIHKRTCAGVKRNYCRHI